MKLHSKALFISLILLISINIHAQMAPKSVVGMHLQGVIGDQEYKDLKYGVNASFRLLSFPTKKLGTGHLEFDYARMGNVNPFAAGLEDSVKQNRTNRQLNYYGLQLAFSKFALFNNRVLGVKGISIYPVVGIGMTNYRALDPVSQLNIQKVKGFGAKIALIANFPFLSSEFGLKYMKAPSIYGGKKSLFTPYIGLKFDSMFDALGLGSSNEGSFYNLNTTTTTSSSSRDVGGGYFEITTTTVTETYESTTSYVRITHDILFGPTLRKTFASQGYKGATNMYGFGFSFRSGLSGLDASVDVGSLGYGSNVQRSYLNDPYPDINENGIDKKNSFYAAEGNAVILQLRGNINVMGATMKMIGTRGTKVADGNGNSANPSAFRVNIVFGGGYAFLQSPQFLNPAAELTTDNAFLTEPDLVESASNDVRKTKSSRLFSAGMQFEMGAVSLEFGHYYFNKYKAQLGNGNYATIQYTIPINKVIYAYKRTKKVVK